MGKVAIEFHLGIEWNGDLILLLEDIYTELAILLIDHCPSYGFRQ